MPRWLAQVLSLVFHPAIYPILGVFFILKQLPYHYPQKAILMAVALVFCGTYLIPVLVSLLLFRLNLVNSLVMSTAKDRRLPFTFGALSFYLTSVLIQRAGLGNEAYMFLLSSAAVIVIHLAFLSFTKPSAHMSGISGFLGLLIALSLKYGLNFLPYIVLGLLISGLVASARLKLEAHRPSELVLGFFTGLLVVGFGIYFF